MCVQFWIRILRTTTNSPGVVVTETSVLFLLDLGKKKTKALSFTKQAGG